MGFSDFHGNPEVVHTLREMLAHDRFPHALILSGAPGAGKFTLAQMVAKAMNCLEQPITNGLPDFCGHCANCTRIAQADALEDRFAEAVEARENLRDTDKARDSHPHPDASRRDGHPSRSAANAGEGGPGAPRHCRDLLQAV